MSGSSFDISEQHGYPEKKITVALERISEAFRVLLWQESRKNGLSPIQIQILIFLLFHRAERCKVGYLATEFNMTKATVSDSVKVLFQKGLIEKTTDDQDTRSFSMALTESGRVLAEESATFTSPIERGVSGLPAHQREQLLGTMLDLIERLNGAGVVSVQRMCKSCRFFDYQNHNYFCKLLNMPLTINDLRVDCPEHELK